MTFPNELLEVDYLQADVILDALAKDPNGLFGIHIGMAAADAEALGADLGGVRPRIDVEDDDTISQVTTHWLKGSLEAHARFVQHFAEHWGEPTMDERKKSKRPDATTEFDKDGQVLVVRTEYKRGAEQTYLELTLLSGEEE